MTLPESFDPHLIAQSYEQRANVEFLAHELTQEDLLTTVDAVPLDTWREQLLPLSCVAEEDNLTVLRMELETAHQLLHCQQTLLDSLSEQLANSDLQLQHTQDELATTRQTCDHQTAKLSEVEAVCRDLKMQLRRQQQRVLQYRNLLNDQATIHALPLQTVAATSTEMVAIGYESIAIATPSCVSSPKSPPVSAWSAPQSIDLTGPLACYRKLATSRRTASDIRVKGESSTLASACSRAQTVPKDPSIAASPDSSAKKQSVQVDLPRFTKVLTR